MNMDKDEKTRLLREARGRKVEAQRAIIRLAVLAAKSRDAGNEPAALALTQQSNQYASEHIADLESHGAQDYTTIADDGATADCLQYSKTLNSIRTMRLNPEGARYAAIELTPALRAELIAWLQSE
jgi:hypothetical protein